MAYKTTNQKHTTMQARHIPVLLFFLVYYPSFSRLCEQVFTLAARTSSNGTKSRWIAEKMSPYLQEESSRNGDGVPTIATIINGREELFDFLKGDERLCIIKFYASLCQVQL
mmetsp:Transcript_24683/g.36561  ORF Transcript_24683/g.36561 Transcript_24683/m.36561 type:complete len:112 (+) Transcript_24683:2475-2810(+)